MIHSVIEIESWTKYSPIFRDSVFNLEGGGGVLLFFFLQWNDSIDIKKEYI
jgi:hypothetical protein